MMAGGFEAKCEALEKVYRVLDVGQTCIFVNQRAVADRLGEWMRGKGHVVEVLHGGDMDLKKREATLNGVPRRENEGVDLDGCVGARN